MVDLTYIKSVEGAQTDLKWTAEAKADGYVVYMSIDGYNYERKLVIDDPKVTECSVKDLALGRIYYFRIHTYVDVGDHKVYSPSSNVRATLILR